MEKKKWCCRLLFLAFFALISGHAKDSEASNIWIVQQDFVKFGKKEVYEITKKDYFQAFSQSIGKKEGFPSYGLQAFDSPQYVYLIPIGSYNGIDRLMEQKEKFMNAYPSQEWEAQRLAGASTINFLFKSLKKFLPSSSSIPKGQESLSSLPRAHLYWIQIAPGQEGAFENHLQQLVQKEMKRESPGCWRVWRGTFGDVLPQYFIAVFATTEKEAEEAANRIEFVSGPIKQIVRKLKQDRVLLRPDLSMNVQ